MSEQDEEPVTEREPVLSRIDANLAELRASVSDLSIKIDTLIAAVAALGSGLGGHLDSHERDAKLRSVGGAE